MFGLWAAHRWSLPAAVILWIALTSTFWLIGDRNPRVRAYLYRIARHDGRPASEPDYEHYFVRHPLADWQRLKLWPKCWQLPRSDRERVHPVGPTPPPRWPRGRVLVGRTRRGCGIPGAPGTSATAN